MSASVPAPRRRGKLRRKLVVACASAITTVALLEGALWLVHPLPAVPELRLHRFLPSWSAIGPAPRTTTVDPGPLAGVTAGLVENAFNPFGYLYPAERQQRRSAEEVRVAVVGGSTVECNMLDAAKRWPAVLERELQAVLARPVTVLNLGISAQDSRTHLATTAHVVTDLDADVCVFLLGANDLGTIASNDHPMLRSDAYYAGPRSLHAVLAALRGTQISRHLRWLRAAARGSRSTPYFAEAAALQAKLPQCPEPVVATAHGLEHYARNVTSLAGLCRAHGIVPLFATQPCMFGAAPTTAEQAVYWGCNTGTHGIAPGNFRDLLAAANACLIATCRQHGFACADLAAEVPTGFASFYDQVHFNEAGAQRVGAVLAAPVRGLLR